MTTATFGNNTGNTYSGTADAFLRENAATTNSNTITLKISKYDVGIHEHSLLKFTGLSNIPAAAIITNATLYLYVQDQAAAAHTAAVRRLLRNWVETEATWNIYSTGNNWATAGGRGAGTDRVDAASASLNMPAATDVWTSVSSAGLIADVQGFVNGTYPNYGWHLERSSAANDLKWNEFDSSASTDTIRPYLEVVYQSSLTQLERGIRGMNRGMNAGGYR